MLVTAWESRWVLDSWGYSSVGRAPALQAGGQEFESPYLHLIIQKALNYQMEKTLGIYSQKSFSFDKRIFFEYPWWVREAYESQCVCKKTNYHQYLENYTLKKIEDIDCQKTIKDINFTDLKNLFFRTRTKKYDYFVIMHSSLKNRAGVLSLMHWNKRSSE